MKVLCGDLELVAVWCGRWLWTFSA